MQVPRSVARLVACAVLSTALAATAATSQADVLVSNGSPAGPFSQNKQNEPALAVDASHPQVLAAGSNDEIDMEACRSGDPRTCPFTPGVGVSGIYFSLDGGKTWKQPMYPGYSARTSPSCNADGTTCSPQTPEQGGRIGTLPRFYENGLVSDGDPALAFGPRRGANGTFSWSNGSRLYYASLASAFPGAASSIRGYEALTVSHTDDPQAAAAGGSAGRAAWSAPVVASKQSSTTFSDKEQIWADNAASSPYFGYVYVCNASFRSNSGGNGYPAPIMLARSTDGGLSFTSKQISAATVNGKNPGRDGCTVRTDSRGRLYVFYRGVDPTSKVEGQLEVRSFDGGASFERPHLVAAPASTAGIFDPLIERPVMDGLAGARADLAPAPSVDVANGAPSGADATDELVMAWVDGGPRIDGEQLLLSRSTNRGDSFTSPATVPLRPGDRPYYAAPAISPDGTDLYVSYNAFTNPYRSDTATPRGLVGGLLHANVNATRSSASFGQIGTPTEAARGVPKDPRASSQNNLVAEFLGDYVYAVATRSYGAGVYNDVRNGEDCPKIDEFRQSYENDVRAGTVPPVAIEDSPAERDAPAPSGGTPPTAPRVQPECPLTFGNTDIYGARYPDPTP